MNIYISSLGLSYLAGGIAIVGVIYDNEQMPELLSMTFEKREEEKHKLFKKLDGKYIAEYRYVDFGMSEIKFFKEVKNNIDSIVFALANKIGLKIQNLNVYIPKTLPKPDLGIIHRIGSQKGLPQVYMANFMAKLKRFNELNKLDIIYPQYSFKLHYGSFTEKHVNAIFKYGVTIHHRQDTTERIALGLARIWTLGDFRYPQYRKYFSKPLPLWWRTRELKVFERKIYTLLDYYPQTLRKKILRKATHQRILDPEMVDFIKSNAPDNIANELFL